MANANKTQAAAFTRILKEAVAQAMQVGAQMANNKAARTKAAKAPVAKKEVVEKKVSDKRRTRNGVTEPAAEGNLRDVWNLCDQLTAKGKEFDVATVRELAEAQGISRTTAQIQFYKWRAFHAPVKRARKA